MQQAGVIDGTKLLVADLNEILTGLLPPLVGTAFVIFVWVSTKSLVKAFLACIAAGAIWWGISNMDFLRDEVGEDIDRSTTSAAPFSAERGAHS
ncbi:hypothetical protein G3I34_04240 [Streptomyces sp. SID8014]|uniref:hypothetical protein n=1 Tax=Streptomyces TaxID=1883 RepID=UPI0013BD8E99|nr:hypothetical protein [Streptomyces sp. SID8014]NEC11527.1 hypothetical protein [Streptomyces sp. SID8014]